MISEKQLHKQICDYIKLQYPRIMFTTDMSGIRLTNGLARQAKNLRSGNGFPDIVIYEPKYIELDEGLQITHALFIEVKKTSPYKKDGKLQKNKHLQEQENMHNRLRNKGYAVYFAWDFDVVKNTIDNYLSK